MSIFDKFKTDVGVDLGTANSLVYLKGEGIIINEPTIIAINNKTNQVIAVGNEAKRMHGRTPAHISVVRPLVNGVISDFLMAQEILKTFFKKIKSNLLFNYVRAVVAIPTNLTEVEKKSVEDAVISSGASSVFLIEEPVAALIGAGLPINEPKANMIVEMGGGTTDMAVVSMGGIVTAKSIKVAGDKLNNDIVQFIRDDFKLAIGEPTAERIKMEIGSALSGDKRLEMIVSGRDLSSGLPKEIIAKDAQIRMAMSQSIRQIVDAVKEIIEKTPPELIGDILRNGIYISGGGGLLKNLDKLISQEVSVKTIVVDDPLTSVARGTGVAAENMDMYKDIFALSVRPINIG